MGVKNRWPGIGHEGVALKKLNKNITKAMRDSEVRAAGLVPKGRGLVSMHLFKFFKVNCVFDLSYVPTLLLEAKTSQSIQ